MITLPSLSDLNKVAYDYLFVRKNEQENHLRITLNWWRYDGGKASYIDYTIEGIGISDETSWKQMAKFHAKWSKKFYDVFVPLLQQWNVMKWFIYLMKTKFECIKRRTENLV